jgi:hypothetical protein
VLEGDLLEIVPEDRAYVAAEMTAFLLSWLSSLQCSVLNRPTPAGLSGPYWRPERWVQAAVKVGIPVQGVERRSRLASGEADEWFDPHTTVLTVVGKRCFGEADSALHGRARLLADLAEVDLLTVYFSGPDSSARFLRASAGADVVTSEVAGGIFDYLLGNSRVEG